MKPHESEIRDLVRQWLGRAEEDYDLVEYLMAENTPYLTAIAFHSQQAAEKFLKAFLVHHQVKFRKTHDLGELLDLVASVDPELADSLSSITILNPYGAQLRYPADFPEMTIGDTKKAFEAASNVRARIIQVLNDYF